MQNLTGELIIAASSWMEASKGNTEGWQKLSGKPFSEGAGGTGYIHSDGAVFNVVPQTGKDCPRYLQEGKERVSFCVQGQNVEVDKKIADGILDPLLI